MLPGANGPFTVTRPGVATAFGADPSSSGTARTRRQLETRGAAVCTGVHARVHDLQDVENVERLGAVDDEPRLLAQDDDAGHGGGTGQPLILGGPLLPFRDRVATSISLVPEFAGTSNSPRIDPFAIHCDGSLHPRTGTSLSNCARPASSVLAVFGDPAPLNSTVWPGSAFDS